MDYNGHFVFTHSRACFTQRNQIAGQAGQKYKTFDQLESKTKSPIAVQSCERTNELIDQSEKFDQENQNITPKKKIKASSKKRKKHSINLHDENRVLTPVVVINNNKGRDLKNGNVLKPKLNYNHSQNQCNQTSKDNFIFNSKPSTRKRSKDKLNQLDDKSRNDRSYDDLDTPPSRKARLSYFKSLDNLALEEETII